MKKCVLISDSFKGSLSTFEIISLFKEALNEVFPSCELLSFPISDGGEGTMEVFSTIYCGEIHEVSTFDANLLPIKARYFLTNSTAYMDVSSVVSLAKTKIKDPKITSTYGIGLLIKDAIFHGAKTIYLGLGGSSTNDMGFGMVKGLGGKFINENNEEFLPTGISLNQVKKIDLSEFYKNVEGISFIGLSDVNNPLVGENGCSRIYAKQKGASEEETYKLDEIMKETIINLKVLGFKDVSNVSSSGAAGGIGAGLLLFFNAKLESGINYILKTISFEERIKDCDCIFTGEGNLDSQSNSGKVIDGIREIAKRNNIPLVAIVGGADLSSENLINEGINSIVTTTRKPMEFEKIKKYSKDFYKVSALNALRLIKLGEKIKR